MKLTITGSIDLGNGYIARFTKTDDWLVSIRDRVVGYAPDLGTAETMARDDASKRAARLAELARD